MRAWRAAALAFTVSVASLSVTSCGPSNGTSASPTSLPATSTTGPTTTTTPDGTQIDRLPTVPPSSAPTASDLSTVAGQIAFLGAVFNDIQSVWRQAFNRAGIAYSPARLNFFQSQVSTACGVESANVGPFYCPGDRTVYLDIRFFQALEAQFGVSGDFAEAYVVAHEVGHHVQYLLGITNRVGAVQQANPARKNALSVGIELQADCFAGVWAHSAYQRNLLEEGDIQEALNAAQVVGDDFLAQASGSTVDPDSWTHGSSAQRQQWFTTGYREGRPAACDTFAAA